MITQARLKEVLHYAPATGVFTWLVSPSRRVRAGSAAGCLNRKTGYLQISIDTRVYSSHRLAWLYLHGELPKKQIDHKDTIKTNNRADNLRLASHSQNMVNRPVGGTNTSGYKGVSWYKKTGKWRARCRVNGRQYNLGCFDTAKEASEIYSEFALKHHGEYYYQPMEE